MYNCIPVNAYARCFHHKYFTIICYLNWLSFVQWLMWSRRPSGPFSGQVYVPNVGPLTSFEAQYSNQYDNRPMFIYSADIITRRLFDRFNLSDSTEIYTLFRNPLVSEPCKYLGLFRSVLFSALLPVRCAIKRNTAHYKTGLIDRVYCD